MKPVTRFTLAVFLWLPVCFAVWYYASILFVVPIAASVDVLMQALLPGLIDQVQQRGNGLVVLTEVAVPTTVDGVRRYGEVVFELNPLKYGYSVPLYTALVFASPTPEAQRLGRWVIGVMVLFSAQAFGVATEVLKVLAFDAGPSAREALDLSVWQLEALALLYQFGFLILPPVMPILLWIWQFRRELPEITGLGRPGG